LSFEFPTGSASAGPVGTDFHGADMNIQKRQKHKKSKTPSEATTRATKRSFLRAEWPLLSIPVLILAALALVHIADRTIQKELCLSNDLPGNTQETHPATPAANAGTADQSPTPASTTGATHSQDSSAQQGLTLDQRRARALAAHRPGRLDARPLGPGGSGGAPRELAQSPAGTFLASLRQAVKTQDHTRIKKCMRGLVALGDDAVASLTEIIASGKDETALWAAEALARIGTPTAATALLDTLEQIKDGPYKEQLAKYASSISNHDSWPVLLDMVQETKDPTVQRAAATSLANMADTPVIDEIVARYNAAETKEEQERLAQVVSNVDSPEASASLQTLAGDVSSPPQDTMQRAAIEAMANTGDPQSVSYLMQKLEASPPGEGAYVFNAITTIDQPEAESALLYAAAGSKEVSAEQGRTAAIYALENYPSEETCRLLEQIVATEDNIAVATAAARTLDSIEKKTPAIVQKTISKADTTSMLPVNPLQK